VVTVGSGVRGVRVGVLVTVGFTVRVGVPLRVAVPLGVVSGGGDVNGVAEAVGTVSVTVALLAGDPVVVGVCAADTLAEADGVAVGLASDDGLAVAVDSTEPVADGVGVSPSGVSVSDAVAVLLGVTAADGLGLPSGGLGVSVGGRVDVSVGGGLLVAEGVAAAVWDAVIDDVGVARVAVGVGGSKAAAATTSAAEMSPSPFQSPLGHAPLPAKIAPITPSTRAARGALAHSPPSPGRGTANSMRTTTAPGTLARRRRVARERHPLRAPAGASAARPLMARGTAHARHSIGQRPRRPHSRGLPPSYGRLSRRSILVRTTLRSTIGLAR